MMRSLLAVVGVGVTSLCATACEPMDTSESGEDDVAAAQQAQVPAYRGDPDYAQLIDFRINDVFFVKTAVTSEDPNLRDTAYAWNTEYWRSITAPGNMAASMSMTLSHAEYTESQINSFFSGYSAAFDVGQLNATWTQWSSTTQPSMSGLTCYLYQATDPDNSSVSIGLVLGVNTSGYLQSIVWYNTVNPTTGMVWESNNAPTSLSWTYVGQTSAPSSITPTSSNWYWVKQG